MFLATEFLILAYLKFPAIVRFISKIFKSCPPAQATFTMKGLQIKI